LAPAKKLKREGKEAEKGGRKTGKSDSGYWAARRESTSIFPVVIPPFSAFFPFCFHFFETKGLPAM
jgi:hypothetical protein